MKIERYAKNPRFWAIYDEAGELVAVVVYKRGAQEIVKRLQASKEGAGR
jgi:hypothetical protein